MCPAFSTFCPLPTPNLYFRGQGQPLLLSLLLLGLAWWWPAPWWSPREIASPRSVGGVQGRSWVAKSISIYASAHPSTCLLKAEGGWVCPGGWHAAQGLFGGWESWRKAAAMVVVPRGATTGTIGIAGAGAEWWIREEIISVFTGALMVHFHCSQGTLVCCDTPFRNHWST